MAKRRAEVSVMFEVSSKKPHRSHHAGDAVLENVSAAVGVCLSPGSLSPGSLPDRCCRKRPHHLTEPEQKHEEVSAAIQHDCVERKKNPAEVLTVETSGGDQNRTSPGSKPNVRKRAREEQVDLKTSVPEATVKVSDGDTGTEDSVFNSFQFWRAPLPQLDPSLLEELSTQCQTDRPRTKVKNSSSDAMET